MKKLGLGLSTRSKKAAKVLSDQAQLKAMLLYTDIACKVNGTTIWSDQPGRGRLVELAVSLINSQRADSECDFITLRLSSN